MRKIGEKLNYSGRSGMPARTLQFKPLWFSVSQEELNRPRQYYVGSLIRVIDFPKLTCESLHDPDDDLNWVSFCRARVWGARGDRAFLLVPRPSYLGAIRLELHGDWLYIFGEVDEDAHTLRDIT